MNISPAAVAAPSRLPGTARPRALWRSVAVPTEHGGWGLTFEPVLLGLIVAPSWAGAARAGLPDGAFDARVRTMDVRAAAVARGPGGDKKDPP